MIVEFCQISLYGLIYSVAVELLFVNTLLDRKGTADAVGALAVIEAIGVIIICLLWVGRLYRAGHMRVLFVGSWW